MPNNKGLTNLTRLGLGMSNMTTWAMPTGNERRRRANAALARRLANAAAAAQRQANTRRRLNAMRQSATRQSTRLAAQRSTNINTLITRANAALSHAARAGPNKESRIANYHRARNAIINRLGAPVKSARVRDILRRIMENKNRIVNNINWQNDKKRWWTWEQVVAHELGGGSNFPSPVPMSQFAPRKYGRSWKPKPATMNVANTAAIARELSRMGF